MGQEEQANNFELRCILVKSKSLNAILTAPESLSWAEYFPSIRVRLIFVATNLLYKRIIYCFTLY